MSTTIVIRPATPTDASTIAEVQLAAWRATYGHLAPALIDGFDPGRTAANWARAVAAGDGRIAVALCGEALVGYASSGPPDHSGDDPPPADGDGELHAIYVHPDWHGHGAGRLLLADALAALVADGRRGCLLWVARDNPRARRFYERSGFTADGAVADWRGIATVRYRRPLP